MAEYTYEPTEHVFHNGFTVYRDGEPVRHFTEETLAIGYVLTMAEKERLKNG
jgi:hypothetical protein